MWRSLRLLVRVGILTVVVSVSLSLVVRATTGAVADLVYAAQAPSAAREWSLDRLVGDLASPRSCGRGYRPGRARSGLAA